MKLLIVDNGSFEIRAVYNGRVLPVMQNIAFKIPPMSTTSSSSLSGEKCADTVARNDDCNGVSGARGDGPTASSSVSAAANRGVWVVGDEAERLPFSALLRGRGKRPLGLGGLLVDAPLQARIWRRLVYGRDHAGLSSETDVDLVVTVQPGSPKECAVLWYTLCFVLFRFKSVTFVAPGWLEFLSTVVAPSLRSGSNSVSNHNIVGGDHGDDDDHDDPFAVQKPKPKAKGKAASKSKSSSLAAAAAAAAASFIPATTDPFQHFSNTSALVLDVGFAGTRCLPVVNLLPRRCGYLRLDIGMFHVAHFLTRLISFTQMNLLSSSLPDFLMHKGILEHTLEVDRHAASSSSSSCATHSTALQQHLYGWERAFVRATASENDSEMEKKRTMSSLYFQGTFKRRIRGRNVQGQRLFRGGGKKKKNIDNCGPMIPPPPPPPYATLWFVLPTEEDDQENDDDENEHGDDNKKNKNAKNDDVSAAGKQQRGAATRRKNAFSAAGASAGSNNSKRNSNSSNKNISKQKEKRRQALKFGHLAKIAQDESAGLSDSGDDENDAAANGSALRKKQDKKERRKKRRDKENLSGSSSSGSGSSDDDNDSSDSNEDASEEGDDDDDDDDGSDDDRDETEGAPRFEEEDDDAAILRLDHERFIGAELLFQPRAIVGSDQVAGRINAAFGSGNTISALIASTALLSSHVTKEHDEDHAEHADGVSGEQQITSSSVGFSSVAASAGGGCVSILVESFHRFAPSVVANAWLSKIVAIGGACNIRGFADRLRNEVASNLSVRMSRAVQFMDASKKPGDDEEDEDRRSRLGWMKSSFDAFRRLATVNGPSDDGEGSDVVALFLARCRIERGITSAPSMTKQTHEQFVDRVFAAMQAILV